MFIANIAETVFPHISHLAHQDSSTEHELNKLVILRLSFLCGLPSITALVAIRW